MQDKLFFTDVSTATLEYAGDSAAVDGINDVKASDLETVTLDSPWNNFFDTDEYVQFEATVAQPIVQPYFYDGELKRFQKAKDELEQAQAQLDNLPWTVKHPPEDRITTADQIRGFWTDPEYDDGQQATLNIPYNDTDGIRFALQHGDVSVGFSGTLDWDSGDEMVDAVQRDMAYDHVASVKNGRCPPEKGCGLHADDEVHDMSDSSEGASPTRCGLYTDDVDPEEHNLEQHGHVTDNVQTQMNEEDQVVPSNGWSEGDWVSYMDDGQRFHGQIDNIDGDTVTVLRYDGREETLTEEMDNVPINRVNTWVGPHADSCDGLCTCGCHDSASRGYHESSTTTRDCHVDAMSIEDTITFNSLSGGKLDESEIPNEGYEPHYVFAADTKSDSSYPLVDADGNLRRGNVSAAWELYGQAQDEELLLDVLAQANERFADHDDFSAPISADSLKAARTTDTTDTMSNSLKEFIDEHDLTDKDIIDALDIDLQALDSVPNEPIDFYDGEPSIEDLADDFPTVQMLVDQKEDLEVEVAELTDELRETKRPTYEQKVEELVEIADDAFGSEEELMEAFDAEDEDERLTIDDIDEKIDRAKTIKGTDTTTTDSSSDGGEDEDVEVESSMQIADDAVETTSSGRYNLSNVR